MTDEDRAEEHLDLAAHHAHRRRYFRLLGALGVGLVLAVAVPLLLVAQVTDVGRSDAWPFTLLLAMWAGARLALAIASGKPMLFDFFFWVFTYIFMGLAPSVQIRSGEISNTTPDMDPALDLSTALLVWLGVICYEAGRLLAVLRERGRASSLRWANTSGALPSRPAGTQRVARVKVARALILALFGVVATAYYVSRIGFGDLFVDRYQAQDVRAAIWTDPATRSVVYSLAVYPLLVGVGALAMVRREARRALKPWYSVAITMCALLLLLVVNPVSSARYSLGTVLFALVIYAGAMTSPTRIRASLMATIGGFVFLFPMADAFRTGVLNVTRDGFFGEYRGNADYDAFWQIANAHSYVLDGLVQFGQQALGSLLFWVPRSLWANKPVDTGILLAQYRGYSFDNLSAPLWAEFLVNGGVGFLVVGFLVVGYLLRAMDTKLLPAFAAAGYWAIVGAIFPVYMTILLRGSLLQATGAVAVAIACLLFARQWSPGGSAPQVLQLPEPLDEQQHRDHQIGGEEQRVYDQERRRPAEENKTQGENPVVGGQQGERADH